MQREEFRLKAADILVFNELPEPSRNPKGMEIGPRGDGFPFLKEGYGTSSSSAMAVRHLEALLGGLTYYFLNLRP